MQDILFNQDIYNEVILDKIPAAKSSVLIGTADIKNLYTERNGRFFPFLQVLSELVARGVRVTLIHAKEPGPRFREDFDSYPLLIESDKFQRVLCPRVHFKIVIIDDSYAYVGSANLTGAGMGAKNKNRRNFELGFSVTDKEQLLKLKNFYSMVYSGKYCTSCERRLVCSDPIN